MKLPLWLTPRSLRPVQNSNKKLFCPIRVTFQSSSKIQVFILLFKKIQPVGPKGNQPWIFIGRTDTEAETPIFWPPDVKSWLIGKDSDWEGLGAGGEGDDRGWDGWMVSPTQWTWVWVNSGSWWWTGRPGLLQFMGSQRVRHDWVTELYSIYQFCPGDLISSEFWLFWEIKVTVKRKSLKKS